MTPTKKNAVIAIASLLVIAGSASWIYYREFKAPKHDVGLHRRVGEVMAEQTVKLVGSKGRLVLITIPTGAEPELKTQLEAFRRTLKKLGDYEIKEHEMDTKDQAKYGLGAGLSGRRFVRTVKNNPKADAIISFVGAPKLSDEEIAELTKKAKRYEISIRFLGLWDTVEAYGMPIDELKRGIDWVLRTLSHRG